MSDTHTSCSVDASVMTHVFTAEAKRRGMGAIMLRKPQSLAKLVSGIAKDSELPLTVKVRTGVDKVRTWGFYCAEVGTVSS